MGRRGVHSRQEKRMILQKYFRVESVCSRAKKNQTLSEAAYREGAEGHDDALVDLVVDGKILHPYPGIG